MFHRDRAPLGTCYLLDPGYLWWQDICITVPCDAEVCEHDTLVIVTWDALTGTVYDTCVQIVHVVEPVPVPLLTAPVLAVLVFVLIGVAALLVRKRSAGAA